MRVHVRFKDWTEKIKKNNPELSSVKITELITRHKDSEELKLDLSNYSLRENR